MLKQFGSPQGELAAACRYFTQYLAEDDPGRCDMLIDIATEELSHLKVIGTIVQLQYFNMSQGEGDARGPWNNDATFDYREPQLAVEGGSGKPEIALEPSEQKVVDQAAMRLRSDPHAGPVAGAMLGMNGGNGVGDITDEELNARADPKAATQRRGRSKDSAAAKSR